MAASRIHAVVGLEAVHLHQQRVQRLLALVVSPAQARAPVASDRIDLIHEDDAGRMRFALLEEIAHARGAHAHEHLDEVGAGHLEEGTRGLTRHRPREQGLAGARGTHQKHALGQAATQAHEALRILQELDDLLELLLGLVRARDVLERHLGRVGRDELGLGTAELKGPVAPALEAAHEPDPDPGHEDPGKKREHPLHDRDPRGPCPDDDVARLEFVEQPVGDFSGKHGDEAAHVFAVTVHRGAQFALHAARIDDRDLANVAGRQLLAKLGVGELDARVAARTEDLEEEERHERQQNPE